MSLVGTEVRNLRLVDTLGRGGMGEVYLGIDTVLERKVAVKVVRADRRMDASAKVRFLREARILSHLEHVNICRIYEYIEEDEVDFIVLELVDGTPLSRLLAEGVSDRQRRSIADQVAAALVAAHSLSVIHRDLKPANVMVSGDGAVKILDFGLARLAADADTEAGEGSVHRFESDSDPRQDDRTTLTGLGDVLGTPRYMSPEQARGEPSTAASDMYSFGLLLQEMFSETPPYPLDLPRPKLQRQVMWGETAPVTGADPQLKGLIEELKSLSPGKRPTAAAAAERLAWIWETPRRRTRRLLAAGVTVVLALATVVSTWGFVTARRSELAARRAQAQAEAVSSFLQSMLKSPRPVTQGRDVKVVDVLDEAVTAAGEEFVDYPERKAAVEHTLGETYSALGRYERAAELLTHALQLRQRVLGVEHPDTLRSDLALVRVRLHQGEYEEGEARARAALEVALRTLGPGDAVTLEARHVVAYTLDRLGRYDEAEPLLRETIAGREELLGPDHPETLATRQVLSWVLRKLGRYAEAEEEIRRVLGAKRRVLGENHFDTANATSGLASILFLQGRYDQAEALAREVVAVHERLLGPDHPGLAQPIGNLAVVVSQQGRHAEAAALYARSYDLARRGLGEDHPYTQQALNNMGIALRRQGRYEESERTLRRALAAQRRVLGDESLDTTKIKINLAQTLLKRGRYEEALELLSVSLEQRRGKLGPENPLTLSTVQHVGEALLGLGRAGEAKALLAEAYESAHRSHADVHGLVFPLGETLATALERTGESAAAISVLQECLELRPHVSAGDSEVLATADRMAARLERLTRSAAQEEAATHPRGSD